MVFAAIIWGPYEGQQRFAEPSKVESAFFEALSRLSWAVALAWIVFICCQGRGGIINSFLSCPLWQPLSRLSYAIYIIHLVVQITVVGLVRTDVYLSNYSAVSPEWFYAANKELVMLPIKSRFHFPKQKSDPFCFVWYCAIWADRFLLYFADTYILG